MSESSAEPRIVVIGIGNPIMGDDGIGLALLHRVQAHLAGENTEQVTQAFDDEAWRPTGKPGAITSVAQPGLLHATTYDGIGFVDGGTAGLELVDVIAEADNLLVLDAIAGSGPVGSVVVLEGEQIPRLLKTKLSPHQVGLLDLLATTQLLGATPDKVAVVGIVADKADLQVGLSPLVEQALPAATEQAVTVLRRWQSENSPTAHQEN